MKSYSISQRNKSRGSNVWYGREYEGGVLVKEVSLKTTNKKEAKIWLDTMNASRFLPEGMVARRSDPVSIVSASNAYLDMESGHVSDHFLTSLKSYIGKFRSFCGDVSVTSFDDFGRLHAEKFYQSMEGKKENTKRVVIVCVKAMFDWVIDAYGLNMKNPFTGIKMAKVVKVEKKFWTEDEIETILDNADGPADRLFMAVMAYTGLRHHEAVKFNPYNDINDGMIRTVGKGSKEAFIPLSDKMNGELARVQFVEGMFTRFRKNDRANDAIRAAVERAGMDSSDATCHKFRHSFISNMARNGVTESVASRIARHSNIQTTMQYYTHFRDEDLKEAINTKKEG